MKNFVSLFFFLSFFFFPSLASAASVTLSEISTHTKPLHYVKVSVPQNFDCHSLSFAEAETTRYYDTTVHLIHKQSLFPKYKDPSSEGFCIFDFKEGLTPRSSSTVTYVLSYDENNPPLLKDGGSSLQGDREVTIGAISISWSAVPAITAFGEEKPSFSLSFCFVGDYTPSCRLIPSSFSGVTLRNLPKETIGSLSVEIEENPSFVEKGGCSSLSFFESHYNSFYNFYTYNTLRFGTVGKQSGICTFLFPRGFTQEESLGYGIMIPEGVSLVFKTESLQEKLPDTFIFKGEGLLCCGGGSIPTLSFLLSDPLFFSLNEPAPLYPVSVKFDFTPFCEENCNSNILFLPGIIGSRLYEEEDSNDCSSGLVNVPPPPSCKKEYQRWVSSSDKDHERLSLDSEGKSIHTIYTKNDPHGTEGVVVDDTYSFNIYQSFSEDLQKLKSEDKIADYSLVPYDWRLSLEDIITNGADTGRKVSYTQPQNFSESLLKKQFENLVKTSRTGKVTIVAHSNGGLVAKAFLQKLKDSSDPLFEKIDKLILVAVPQAGTPDALVALFHGSKIGWGPVGISAERFRDLSRNMPTTYNLLPTKELTQSVGPLITFQKNAGDATKNMYGASIDTYDELGDFIANKEGRINPPYSSLTDPAVGNSTLFEKAVAMHQKLDSFLPAQTTEVYQIAGWGLYTKQALLYEDDKKCLETVVTGEGVPVCTKQADTFTVNTKDTVNGDETVLAASALYMTGENVKNYWVDLGKYNLFFEANIDRTHKDIFEVSSLRTLLTNIFTSNTSSLPDYIKTSEPSYSGRTYTKISSHSPVYLTLIDDKGNITGYSSTTKEFLTQIPGSQYSEIGDIKTVYVPQDTKYTSYLTSYDNGSVTLTTQELSGDTTATTTTYKGIPLAPSTKITLSPQENGKTILSLDYNGDGVVDTKKEVVPGRETVYEEKKREPEVIHKPSPSYGVAFVFPSLYTMKKEEVATTTASTTFTTTTKQITTTQVVKQTTKVAPVKTVKKTAAQNTQKVATTTKQGATSTKATTTAKTNVTQEVAKPTLLEKIKRFFFGSSY
jgi:hypothetical protein